jgi:uncharacterized protein involved in tolerance to divalent cations
MTTVLGVDIGAKFVVAFCLNELPTGMSYPAYYRKNAKTSIFKVRMDSKKNKPGTGIDGALALLTELAPDVIVMEPTGVWYSRLWAKLAEHLAIQVKWIGHNDLAFNRGAYGFEDKDDRTDAFCLAVSYFDPTFNSRSDWLYWRTGELARVNQLMLEVKSLQATTKILQQQIRQRLKYEFPEIADRSITNARGADGFTPWLGYLANIHIYTRIKKERERSIATVLGVEISQYTRDHAAVICGNQIRDNALKAELVAVLLNPAFDNYRDVFEAFGFGCMMQACVLSQVYPFEKFLIAGKPHIDRYEDDQGKHKKNKSLAGFQLSLGMGKRLFESGGSSSLVYAGSSYARKELFCWTMTNVMPIKMCNSWLVTELNRRAESGSEKSLTIAQLRNRWQTTKGTPTDRHKASVRSAMTINYRVTRLLYDELLKKFHLN